MKGLAKNLAIFVSGLIVAILLVLFGIKPMLGEISAIHDNIKQQKTELLTLDQQILAFKTAQSDLSKATRREEIDTAIPTRETLVDSVKDLELAMSQTLTSHELKIKDPTLEKNNKLKEVTTNRPGIEEIPYTLIMTNDFVGILNALAYLEHLPHFTEISKIDLSAETTSSAGGEAVHTGRVIGNIQGVFFVKQP